MLGTLKARTILTTLPLLAQKQRSPKSQPEMHGDKTIIETFSVQTKKLLLISIDKHNGNPRTREISLRNLELSRSKEQVLQLSKTLLTTKCSL